MADVHGGEHAQGIKLFGKTITLQRIQAKDDQEDKDDQAVDKRPDKIIPCPRCKSMETKFCYFNNYNVNQPRHFCKGCQRYWTAGGALRNVPVGAGRRKNKPAACRGVIGFSEGCLYDASGTHPFELNGMAEEWNLADQRGFLDYFPAKRLRSSSGNENTC